MCTWGREVAALMLKSVENFGGLKLKRVLEREVRQICELRIQNAHDQNPKQHQKITF